MGIVLLVTTSMEEEYLFQIADSMASSDLQRFGDAVFCMLT